MARASIGSAMNGSAPSRTNRCSLFGFRPITRTRLPWASSVSVTTLPVLPVAPVTPYKRSFSSNSLVISKLQRQQILDLHRQFSHANSGRVVHRRRDGGSDTGLADLADAAGAHFVNLFVGEVEEMHLDRRRVGVDRYHVVGQIT